MSSVTTYTATATATATSLTDNGVVVSASATASYSSTISTEDATNQATALAEKDAQTQADYTANTLDQSVAISEIIQDNYTLTTRTSAGTNPAWTSICYGNGIFVAVGNKSTNTNETIMTSLDGVNWIIRKAPANDNLVSVCYGNGLFVAVSSSTTNLVITSPDGINWTQRTTPSSSLVVVSICYGNDLFIAITTSCSSIFKSNDGINWTLQKTTIVSTSVNFKSVCYGNGLFIAVGDLSTYVRSSDGITWTSANFTGNNTYNWTSVCYGNGTFVAVTNDKSNTSIQNVQTSPDGKTWTSVSAPIKSWTSVSYGNGIFFAVANNSTFDNGVMVSEYGNKWKLKEVSNNALFSSSWTSTCYGNGTFVAVASSSGAVPPCYVMTCGKQSVNVESSIEPWMATNGNIITYPGFKGNVGISGNVNIGNITGSAPLTICANSTTDPDKNGLYIYNPNNSSSQNAICSIQVAGSAAGDAFTSYDISAEGGWSTGIKNSDNSYRIANNWSDLSNNTRLSINTSGQFGMGTTNQTSTIYSELNGYSQLALGYTTKPTVQFRNDGANFYMLLTKDKDPYGKWNDLLPFYMNTSNGNIKAKAIHSAGMLCGFYNDSGSANLTPRYYIYSSQANLEANDRCDYWWVLPGYTLIIYNDTNYKGGSETLDNINGTNVLYFGLKLQNNAGSVKAYFNGVEILIEGIS